MIQLTTSSARETREVASTIAALVEQGDLVLLVGELGAGKTTFAQGFGQALGITDPITSPTFTLAREYEGERITMHHLDVYRLEQIDEVLDLALPELLDGASVTLIEWGDAIIPALPAEYLEVRLEYGDDDDERVISVRLVGSRWLEREHQLTRSLDGIQH
ncbi:MAG: tRNA (adenosine(37)-N6)-threonylcarbamoyltransferase complex ATPase subunit type 1 TsaE [Acidimicrobiales bacterium]